ncbi:hypothetical protein HSBAA_50460 [Vreelandella sulfidaeris]|uniref:Mur ligase C-terminal domain-containing protein n=1 Tax=Vreelandella sulfidaeris TaxID=115553 RepID=A0A455UBY0_9GAMM|nr:hypothetical protein HSBAA_50460 [Halomonas sulfidaeris]
MRQGHVEAEVIPVVDVPITFEGHARFNVANALAASAAAYALGLSIADIQMGLQTFHPTPGQNPGRTNLIDADGMKVLIDYGHNVPALEALSGLVGCIPARRRISVASAPGNRRDEDLFTLGTLLARMHDVVFIYETDARGRTPGDAARLLREGAESVPGTCRVEVIMEEQQAVERAFEEASEGDLLVLLIDDVDSAIERIRGAASGRLPPQRQTVRRHDARRPPGRQAADPAAGRQSLCAGASRGKRYSDRRWPYRRPGA